LGDLTLQKISFEWIKECKKIKLLKKAIKLIEEDGKLYENLIRKIIGSIHFLMKLIFFINLYAIII